MLDVNQLTTRLGDQSFHWEFSLAAGDLMAIVGASGLGKSTLLNVLCGLLPASGGDVRWRGRNVLEDPVHQRPFGILFQSHNLFEHLSVEINLALGIDPSGRITGADRERLRLAARRFDIENLLDRTPDQLSGGQQQRAALARVFLQRKPILLLDEPFSSLDPALRQEGLSWVRDMQAEQGSTVLLVTHHLDEMLSATDQVLLGLTNEQWLSLETDEFERQRAQGAFRSLLGVDTGASR